MEAGSANATEGNRRRRVGSALAVVTCAALWTTIGGRPSLAEAPDVEFVFVPGSDMQPDGPAYDFRIGRFEVRNDQFDAFLSDALIHLDNARGQFMFFDTDTGRVTIHTAQTGASGTGGTGAPLFDPAVNTVITPFGSCW